MSVALFVLAFCVVALLGYTARYSGRIRVECTRIVDAAEKDAYPCIVDLRRWPEWSPWVEGRSAADSRHSGPSDAVKGSYRWLRDDGDLGCVEHLRIDGPGRVEQRLRLWRPFPLRARLRWQLADCEGKTRLTCAVRGRVGFSMRPFAATVQGALALDVRYGLDRLARLVEPDGAAGYAIRIDGVREIGAVRYAYVEHTGSLDGIAHAMGRAVRELATRSRSKALRRAASRWRSISGRAPRNERRAAASPFRSARRPSSASTSQRCRPIARSSRRSRAIATSSSSPGISPCSGSPAPASVPTCA